MKKFLMTALAIWIGGAVLMSIYYELRVRVDCIRDEGLFKGVFWCESQPKTPPSLVTSQTNFIFRGLAWPYFLVAGLTSSNTNATPVIEGEWGVFPNMGAYTIASATPVTGADDLKAILLVFFNPKNACDPELSLLVLVHNKLGDPISSDKTSTSLRVSVGNFFQKDYFSAFNRYTSGVEYAIPLDEGLLRVMGTSQVMLVKASNADPMLTFSLSGFGALAAYQREACLKS